MNPQAKILDRSGALNMVINAVNTVLIANSPQTMSSNELLRRLPTALQIQLSVISNQYQPKCACGQAASYVGTAAAILARINPNVLHIRHHYCPILNRYDDAFRI
jgi:hypothetical protein